MSTIEERAKRIVATLFPDGVPEVFGGGPGPDMSATMTAEEYNATVKKSGVSKYKNVKATRIIDGKEVKFHSEMEARRYDELEFLLEHGKIERLTLQPRYRLAANDIHICTYVADFTYIDRQTGEWVTEDVKGYSTSLYSVKKRLMKACHDIDVIEVTA